MSIPVSGTFTALSVSVHGNDVVVVGEIDAHTRAELDHALARITVGDLDVDMTDVTFIDSSGLRSLISAHLEAEALGHRFRLIGPRPSVVRMFEVSGIGSLFTIVD